MIFTSIFGLIIMSDIVGVAEDVGEAPVAVAADTNGEVFASGGDASVSNDYSSSEPAAADAAAIAPVTSPAAAPVDTSAIECVFFGVPVGFVCYVAFGLSLQRLAGPA